jgi:hypothetical protein
MLVKFCQVLLMKAKLLFFFMVYLFIQDTVKAQSENDSLLNVQYAEAKNFIDAKKFDNAYESFKKIFKLKTTVPDELAYFYGYTLINLNKYTAGKEALKKYISLKGDTGRYYKYSLHLLNLADCKETGSYFIEEQCAECHGEGSALMKCRTCNGKGKELCHTCGGAGVIKKKEDFGLSYNTCPKCNGNGDQRCSTCNGSGQEKTKCYVCDGRGKVKVKRECDALLMGEGRW